MIKVGSRVRHKESIRTVRIVTEIGVAYKKDYFSFPRSVRDVLDKYPLCIYVRCGTFYTSNINNLIEDEGGV